MTDAPRTADRWRFAPALVVVAAALLLLVDLGGIDLWAPDEPRIAEVAEELRRQPNGPVDLVVLRLNGEVYTQKPPLYYWLAAAAGTARGRVDEVAARLPSALAGVGAIAATALAGRLLLGTPTAGALAAGVLLTLPRFAQQARRAQLDVLLALCELIALLAYWRIDARPAEAGKPAAGALALLHGAVALAILTKGPVGALPWLVIVVHRLLDGRARSLGALFPIWGIALATGPALAWLIAATAAAPDGWLGDAVVSNLLGRFFTGSDHARPLAYYLSRLPLEALPWTPLALAGGWIAARQSAGATAPTRSAARLLLAWVGAFFVFFSLSAGKRGIYLLPVLPGVALLAAVPLSRWLESGRLPRAVSASAAALLALAAGAAAWLSTGAPGWSGAASLGSVPGFAGRAAAAITLAGAAGLFVLGVRRRRAATSVILFGGVVLALEAMLFFSLFPALDGEKSPRPLARQVAALAAPKERIGVFRNGALTGGLEYYSGRRVVALETESEVRAFASAGDRVVVSRPRDRAALEEWVAASPRASVRAGPRELLVLELVPSRSARERGADGTH